MTLTEWLRSFAGSTLSPKESLEGENSEDFRRAYGRESALKTLKTGRIASIMATIGLPYFIFQDIYLLKLDVLPWRILGIAPFTLFAIAALTVLPKRLALAKPAYGVCLVCFMAMMSGIVAQVMSSPDSTEYARYVVMNGTVVAMLIAFVFAAGLKRALPPILIAPFAAAFVYLLFASTLSADHLTSLSNPAAVALALSIVAAFQERLAYKEFRMRRLAERRGAIISEKNGELASLNSKLEGALTRLAADLEDKKRAEERILRDRSILQSFLDAVTEPAFVVDSDYLVQFANHAFAARLGREFDSIAGQPLQELIPAQFERYHGQTLESVRKTGKPVHFEIESDGRIVENTVYPVFTSRGEPAYFGLLGKDITERKRSETALADLVAKDALTGLHNRRAIGDALAKAAAKAARGHRSSLLYLDLDNFKTVNDRKGHEAGDEVLKAVAGLLVASVRTEDSVYRLGGDEFAVILDGMGLGESARIRDRLGRTLAQNPFAFGGESFEIGLSAGMVEIAGGLDPAALLAEADAAMYEDKRARKAPAT